MVLDGIPSTWTTCSLDEIAQITQGNGFPKNLQGKTQGKYPFYKVGDISRIVKDGRVKLEESDHYIDEQEVYVIKGNILPPKTIVFAKIGEALKLNRRAMLSKPSLVDNNVAGVKAHPLIDDHFLFHFFLTVNLENYSRATAVPSVRKSDIEKIPFYLPPLNEQRRIVAKIEALFAELAAGVASLRRAQAQLQTYRQALLKHAFAGKLTAQWRTAHADQLEDAHTLLQRIQAERQARYRSPDKFFPVSFRCHCEAAFFRPRNPLAM